LPSKKAFSPLPSREDLLAFIKAQTGKVGKREIARAFGLRGSDRVALKELLGSLADDGLIERRRKRVARPGSLPPAGVLEIVGRDADGELLAAPADWNDGEGPAPRLVLERTSRSGGPAPGVGDRVLARITPAADGDAAPSARLMRVLEKARKLSVGVFRRTPDGATRVLPVEKRQTGELRVPPGQEGGAEDGDLVTVEVTRTGRLGLSVARVRERLGSIANEKAVSMIALHAHGIPHVFPDAALAEAREAGPAPLEGREDWRRLPLVTIDPADAKDHDDAVHAEPDPANPGGFVVTVAIADVAWYVRPGSALDREARLRGNSVYFPDRVVPMLPERISNELCSLRPDEDRPALGLRMVFGADGVKRRHSFHRVMMRSAAKLAYAQAQAAIDGAPDELTGPLLEPVLKPLWAAYRALRAAREARGPLDLDLPERKILLRPDGTVDRVIVPERLDAHRLIEEFMIQANVAAAETLEERRTPLVYRVHDAPSPAKLEALREFLQSLDIKLPKAGNLRPANFNGILARVRGSATEQLVNEVVLRSQAQAEYAPDNYGHFGLNLRRYAHFTSPIRRYADLIVHRALIRALGLGPGGLPEGAEGELAEIGRVISAAERRAMVAERETVDRLIAGFLSGQVGAVFGGRISGVTKSGLFVRLHDTGADGFIPVSTLGEDYYVYDEASHALIGRSSRATHRLGDTVEVRLVEAVPLAGALRFELLSEAGAGGRPKRGLRGRHVRERERRRA